VRGQGARYLHPELLVQADSILTQKHETDIVDYDDSAAGHLEDVRDIHLRLIRELR
jgi:hypothetical protein